MQVMTKEWLLENVSLLPKQEMEQLKEYLEFLVWKTKQQPIKTSLAQQIVNTMEQSTEVTIEDAHSLLTAIKEGQKPVQFKSPFKLENHV
jgi:hypothetical protein